MICRCFLEEDANRILSIRLSMRNIEDIIRWCHTKEGEYRVKSGYYVDFNNWWANSSLAVDPNVGSLLLHKC